LGRFKGVCHENEIYLEAFMKRFVSKAVFVLMAGCLLTLLVSCTSMRDKIKFGKIDNSSENRGRIIGAWTKTDALSPEESAK